ncbi:hypothetical protein BDZ97DRAFT_1913324 [Flammula alnicola]|nr:hypothetical protein BDZ97DRAFT_1913324 [Flammula alnicola]
MPTRRREEDEEEEYFDAHGDGEDEEEDTLYPGLYRALYASSRRAPPRCGWTKTKSCASWAGAGAWAMEVEVEEAKRNGGLGAPKHALVPESYLEPVRLDWEDEEAAVVAAAIANAMPV